VKRDWRGISRAIDAPRTIYYRKQYRSFLTKDAVRPPELS
jgi:hypothetical protein